MSTRVTPQTSESATKVEALGIDTIPEEARTGKPSDLISILIGANLALTLIVIGWFPVAFGLSWWGAASALMVGVIAAAVVLAPAALFGPRTGTNNAVSSGSLFGVGGRLIGTILALVSALGFTALSVWTCGDALLAAANRTLGVEGSDVNRAVSYALVSALIITISIYGFRLLVLAQKVMIPTMGVILLLGVIAFAPQFDPSYAGGEYLLGSFWPTWALSAVIGFSTIIGYGPFVGDWTRYISHKRYNDRKIVKTMFIGTTIGMGIAYLFGAYTAVSFSDPFAPYAESLVLDAPLWYVFPIMLLALGAGAAQGATGLYGTGLDTSSLIPKLNRVQATALLGAIATVLVYVGVFVWDIVNSFSAFITILGIITVPWLTILYYGLWWRRGRIDPDAVQVYLRGEKGGRYWFANGVNLQATISWVMGAITGVLFSATELYVGPFSAVAGGIDIAAITGGIVGLIAYAVLLVVFPEPRSAFVGVAPRLELRLPAERSTAPAETR